jgi:hypothetical protein
MNYLTPIDSDFAAISPGRDREVWDKLLNGTFVALDPRNS